MLIPLIEDTELAKLHGNSVQEHNCGIFGNCFTSFLQEVEFVCQFYGWILVDTLANQECQFVSILTGSRYSYRSL